MSPLDLTVIAVYMLATLGVGLWFARREAKALTADDYFLGARNLPAPAVMLSIVATETSALTVISVPGIAAKGDWTFLQLAFGYLIGRIGVALWLLPGYFGGGQQTAYQRLEARFGRPTRQALSATFLVTRFLADGVRIFAGALPLAVVTGWDVATSIVVMGAVTLLYTLFGGLKAVVWADALQLVVYVAGGAAALAIAIGLGGGLGAVVDKAEAAGKLAVFDLRFALDVPYAFIAALIGGALLSAASHGTDHLIVQRLLATRSLRSAQVALVGSGVLVIAQFALFLAVGTALWAAGRAGSEVAGDQVFVRFIVEALLAGLAGLVIAGILAAAMSTISSSISALASSLSTDLIGPWRGLDPNRAEDAAALLRTGKACSLLWGVLLIVGALAFHAGASGRDTPVVVLALSIASVTYGALLGAYLLVGFGPRVRGAHVIAGAAVAMATMLLVVFASRLAAVPGLEALAPLGRLSWPWYVPLGTLLTVGVGWGAATLLPNAKSA
jgi:SSS family transporter